MGEDEAEKQRPSNFCLRANDKGLLLRFFATTPGCRRNAALLKKIPKPDSLHGNLNASASLRIICMLAPVNFLPTNFPTLYCRAPRIARRPISSSFRAANDRAVVANES
jgi:hypothetical protein